MRIILGCSLYFRMMYIGLRRPEGEPSPPLLQKVDPRVRVPFGPQQLRHRHQRPGGGQSPPSLSDPSQDQRGLPVSRRVW